MDPKNTTQTKKKAVSRAFRLVGRNKVFFFVDFIVILLITFAILYLFGLVPQEFQNSIGRAPDQASTDGRQGELPMHISIPEVGVDADVYNTDSTSTDVLDGFLLKGAVRWPGSGLLGAPGNVLIFGHSTSFKTVINQAFKTFVGLKNLKPGDLIHVYSSSTDYVYSVLTVKMEEASQVLVNFDTIDKLLTLSTCNTSIGDKSARYVVQATFVSASRIPATQ